MYVYVCECEHKLSSLRCPYDARICFAATLCGIVFALCLYFIALPFIFSIFYPP